MLQIGKYKIGFTPLSMIAVFIVLSVYSIVTAIQQYRPEWSMPLSYIIIIKEAMALLATLVYGILGHFVISIFNHFKKV